jgi:hypothetical protein
MAALSPFLAVVVRLLIKATTIELFFEIDNNGALTFIRPGIPNLFKNGRTKGKDGNGNKKNEKIKDRVKPRKNEFAGFQMTADEEENTKQNNRGDVKRNDQSNQNRSLKGSELQITQNSNANRGQRTDPADRADGVDEPGKAGFLWLSKEKC